MLKTKLFEHQERAKKACLDAFKTSDGFGFLMEMGTGKTLATIATAEELLAQGIDGILILAPKTITKVWPDEFQKHTDTPFNFFKWDSVKSSSKTYQAAFSDFLTFDNRVFIVNIEAFQIRNERLSYMLKKYMEGKKIFCVLDESSKIKSHDANRTKAIIALGKTCFKKVILTGTEITNTVLDVYTQFQFLSDKFWPFRNYFCFRNHYAILTDRTTTDGRSFKEIVGFRHLEELVDKVNTLSFRVKAADCLDLPEQIFQTIKIELSKEQRAHYTELKNDLMTMRASGEMMTVQHKVALYTRFRQITGGFLADEKIEGENPKMRALLDLIEDSSEQAIIFASYVEEIKLIYDTLKKDFPCSIYYGDISQDDREEQETLFKTGKTRFFIANPAVAGFGLNLQHSSIELWYSLPTSPEQFWQSLKRIHRPGQKEKCRYYFLQAEGTVDDKLRSRLEAKTDVKDAFASGSIEDFIKLI